MRAKLWRLIRSPLLIFLFALLLRIGLLGVGGTYRISSARDHWNFGGEMGRIARSISQGHGFSSPYWAPTGPTAQQPPVYPYLLAAAFTLFGVYTPGAAFAIFVLNSLFSALTCIVLLAIGRRIFGNVVGTLAAWVWVFWPSASLLPITQIGHESLDALLLTALFWMSSLLEDSRRPSVWALFGALWGLAALSNPIILAILPLLLGWLCWRRRHGGLPWARYSVAAILLAGIVIFPWLVRNYEAFHRPVFIRDDFGLELHLGNHPGATGAYPKGLDPGENTGEWEQYMRLGEWNYMAAMRGEALSFIENHPGEYAWLCLQRFGEFWVWTGDFRPFGSALPPLLWQLFYFLLPALALAGLTLGFRHKVPGTWPLTFILCPFVAAYAVIEYSSPRFRNPIEPEMVLLGAYTVVEAWRWLQARIA